MESKSFPSNFDIARRYAKHRGKDYCKKRKRNKNILTIMQKKIRISIDFRHISIKYGLVVLLNTISWIGITSCATTTENFEKEVIMNANGTLHYSKDINEIVPTQIVQYMKKNGFINPMIPTEIYLNIKNDNYNLMFVKDEDVLEEKRVLFSFNALEIKLNSTLNLDKKIIIGFTNNNLTKTFELPHGSDIINENAKRIFRLKTYEVNDFLIIQYNETMPISEVKKLGDAVKRLKNYFPENRRINMVFINNGTDYTFKLFLLKQYWNNPTELTRARRNVKYFNESGISKKINIMFVDFMTYEETKI